MTSYDSGVGSIVVSVDFTVTVFDKKSSTPLRFAHLLTKASKQPRTRGGSCPNYPWSLTMIDVSFGLDSLDHIRSHLESSQSAQPWTAQQEMSLKETVPLVKRAAESQRILSALGLDLEMAAIGC